jgi:hypothetical protein
MYYQFGQLLIWKKIDKIHAIIINLSVKMAIHIRQMKDPDLNMLMRSVIKDRDQVRLPTERKRDRDPCGRIQWAIKAACAKDKDLIIRIILTRYEQCNSKEKKLVRILLSKCIYSQDPLGDIVREVSRSITD